MCQEVWQGEGIKTVFFSLVAPLDQNPTRSTSRTLFVIDLESAHKSLDFCHTAVGSV